MIYSCRVLNHQLNHIINFFIRCNDRKTEILHYPPPPINFIVIHVFSLTLLIIIQNDS